MLFVLSMRDYINLIVSEELKREERVCGGIFAWMQRKTHRKFKLGAAMTQGLPVGHSLPLASADLFHLYLPRSNLFLGSVFQGG